MVTNRPLVFSLILCWVSLPIVGGSLSVRTSITPDSIQLGQTAIWRVTITAPSSEPLPKASPPPVAGLDYQSQSEDTTYRPQGKQLMATLTQQFVVTPRVPGVFKFPAIQLSDQGKPVRSNPLVLWVASPPEAKPGLPKSAIELVSHVSTQKAYVGQPIGYRLTACLAPGITDQGLLDEHTLTPPLMAGFIELMPHPATSSVDSSHNQRCKTFLSRLLIPMTPGLHTLSEATLVTRFTKQAVTQLSLSEPIDIDVLPIPTPPHCLRGRWETLDFRLTPPP